MRIRGEFFAVKAKDPRGSGECDFWIPKSDVEHWCKNNISRYHDFKSLMEMIPKPLAIFGGLKRNRMENGFCYVGKPSQHQQQGNCPAPKGMIFLVYANKDKIIFEHRWEAEDKDNPAMPDKWKTRFEKLLWKH